MKAFSYIGKKLEQPCSCSCFCRCTRFQLRVNCFSLESCYFLLLSLLGFLILHSLDARTTTFTPSSLDLFFTSVSAVTVSSMSTVEMEVFSNTQLIIMTILMFMGGEIFLSMVGLHLRRLSLKHSLKEGDKVDASMSHFNIPSSFLDQIELRKITRPDFQISKSEQFCFEADSNDVDAEDLKYKCINFLALLALAYLLLVQFLGVVSVLIYVSVISSAKTILEQKGLKALTFALFAVTSTFTNCGFIPTNENMIVFRKNSGLLLILIPQILLGGSLYPPVLRFSIWVIGKFTKKAEAAYLLKKSQAIGYHHLLPHLHSSLLAITVLVFIMVQLILFSSMEWSSDSLSGLNWYQKVVGALFQTVNARHAGETIVDLSTISAAVLVLFVLMMYLPPYTSFFPIAEESCQQGTKKHRNVTENLIFSQLSYLVIFIILVCIAERKQIEKDPLNFSVLNITIEVISAYGNVGFTTGYNCDRRLKPDASCKNKWYGFSGKWSAEGKMILIIVMFFGRLKKFNMSGGKAWKIL